MAGDHELKEILARNPQVDPKTLEQARELLRQTREAGTRRREYGLVSPYTRRATSDERRSHNDPRAVRLRKSSKV